MSNEACLKYRLCAADTANLAESLLQLPSDENITDLGDEYDEAIKAQEKALHWLEKAQKCFIDE